MKKLLIFGGTAEGRELAVFCRDKGIPADISVATQRGAELLKNAGITDILTGRLDCDKMKALILGGAYRAAADATHPYADEATRNIKKACLETGIPCFRLTREKCPVEGTAVKDLEELTELLNRDSRVILSTLGSKELPQLSGIIDRKQRVWSRVLPSEDTAEQCLRYGFDPSHIIAGYPPYSVEDNIRHIRLCGAEILVTKESGARGGYPEKKTAARLAGAELITLVRPWDSGLSMDEIKRIITDLK